MPAIPDLPLHAITAFERLTGLTISVHDHTRSLWSYLTPEHFSHRLPICRVIKGVREDACVRFDAVLMRSEALRHPDGLVKVCHAGLVEWFVPILVDGRVGVQIFAGARRPGPGLDRVLADPSPLARGGPWSPHVAALRPVDDEEAMWILEGLRQLAGRLAAWRATVAPGGRHDLPRDESIRQHIVEHHAEPDYAIASLAAHLGLSASRTVHAVREACGASFIDLLIEVRLRTASGYLRHTSLPVAQVAARCGFGNRSHFQHLFKRRFGTTPARFRRSSPAT
jgi:AraC-like DNA-binding protein